MNRLEKKLLLDLLRIRMIEEEISKKYSQNEMRCPVHLSLGQEAIAVGVCNALKKNDHVYSTHRCHSHYLAKGGNLNRMIAEIYGKQSGCCGGKGGSMHLIDKSCGFMLSLPIVGSIIPISVGASFAFKLRKEKRFQLYSLVMLLLRKEFIMSLLILHLYITYQLSLFVKITCSHVLRI